MTREQVIKHWDSIQAFKDGREIEYYFKNDNTWNPAPTPSFDLEIQYRIKPEPELIPFDFSDAAFLIGKVIKCDSEIQFITQLNKNFVFAGVGQMDYSWLLEKYTFLDGAACGKIKP